MQPKSSQQEIHVHIDRSAVWDRVRGRFAVFLDTSCWIDLADGSTETALRVREALRAGVGAARLFCPLSWGILEELFKQAGASLHVTASLMEELSLNAIFLMRTELFRWELARSVSRLQDEATVDSLSGLFAPPWAFLGSHIVLQFQTPLDQQTITRAGGDLGEQLSGIGVADLARSFGGSRFSGPPPAYSKAAKDVATWYRGDKRQLFLEEAGNCFRMYVTPVLASYPWAIIRRWLEQFSSPGDEVAFFRKTLAQLPALYNHVEIMMASDLQPARKDSDSFFFDNEIVVAPLAYADVFVANDRGLIDTLRNRTDILERSTCTVCESLDRLASWLTDKGLGESP